MLERLAARTGHDLCHYENDAWRELFALYGIDPPDDLKLPTRDEFRRRCQDYETSLYEEKK